MPPSVRKFSIPMWCPTTLRATVIAAPRHSWHRSSNNWACRLGTPAHWMIPRWTRKFVPKPTMRSR
ncbi:hypothetical protein E5720_11485 [Rhodococcus sp. PAMC28707]|nr:hypothetical protein E5769_02530 [Rhodococcus sp. PAMC28705]QCB59028.1 hypothetical protein E5720_11485 [Rhodococcus sp. PAMC28707]